MDIAFKALVGSHNYNLNTKGSDRDYKVFYYPTFNDMYNGDKTSKHKTSADVDIEYHDIRKLPDMLWKSNVNFIEVLFSREITVNDRLYNDLYAIREEIASMNLPYLWDACAGMMYQKLKDAKRDILSPSALNPEESRLKACKSLYQVWRIRKFLFDYVSTDFSDFANSIFVKDEDERRKLLAIKGGLIKENEIFELLESEMVSSEMNNLKLEYKAQPKNEDVDKKVREIVKEYVKAYLTVELDIDETSE